MDALDPLSLSSFMNDMGLPGLSPPGREFLRIHTFEIGVKRAIIVLEKIPGEIDEPYYMAYYRYFPKVNILQWAMAHGFQYSLSKDLIPIMTTRMTADG